MFHPPRNFWKPLPFVRILIPLLAGICLSLYSIHIPAIYWLLGILISLLLFAEWIPLLWKWRLRNLRGLVIVIVFFIAGYLRTDYIQSKASILHLPKQTNITLAITIQDPPEPTQNGWQTTGILQQYFYQNQALPCSGKVLLWMEKDATLLPTGGSTVLANTQLTVIRPPLNPGDFDAAAYYGRAQIFLRCKLLRGQYRICKKPSSAILTNWVYSCKQFCLQTLRKYIQGTNEQAIAEALLIGYKKNLSAELVTAYSETGIVHIIAISGMHMALLFALLNLCLQKLTILPRGKWIKLLIQITAIWLFTWITGGTASVLRAACIFTALSWGEALERKSQPYNTLAGSAFCLLFLYPTLLLDTGFLLSYAAVTGILLLAKPLSRLIYFRNPILRSIWQLNAVTIAAQVFTLPLILYFFHRFPLLFVCTNMIAIPLSGLILYGEIGLLLISGFSPLAHVIGTCIEWSVGMMNEWTIATHRLPFASVGGIYLNGIQAVLLFCALIGWYMAFYTRKLTTLLGSAVVFLLVISIHRNRLIQLKQQQKWVIYQLPGKTVIHLIAGNQQYLLAEPDATLQKKLAAFRTHAIWYWGAQNYSFPSSIQYAYPFIRNAKCSLAILRGNDTAQLRLLPGKTDCILLTENVPVSLAYIQRKTGCSEVIFDGSNSMWKIREWKKEAEQLHLRHYATPEQGALIIQF